MPDIMTDKHANERTKTHACDLINRPAAIKAIEDLQDCYNGFSDTYDKACIIGVLEELPSAQPERKKGKWIEEDQYIDKWDDTIEVLRCPFCEFKHDYTQGSTRHDNDGWFNYCPNCGADMRGE